MGRCWPLAERNAPRIEWKRYTENSSYIESIYDLLRESTVPQDFDTALEAGLTKQRLLDQESLISGLQNRLAELRDQAETITRLEQLVRILTASAAAVPPQPVAGASLGDLVKARQIAAGLRRDLAAERKASSELEIVLREVKVERNAVDGELSAAKSEIAALTTSLDTARQELVSQSPRTPVEMSVTFDLGSRSFASTRRLEKGAAELMGRAARLVQSDPDSSIGTSRRVLEMCVREIWRIRRVEGEPPTFGELLDGLHRDSAVPMTDWHLAKQLWTRASGYVHQGGAKPEAALWIWLGTQQIAELVPITRAAGPRPLAPG